MSDDDGLLDWLREDLRRSRHPAALVTDAETGRKATVYYETPEWSALLEWVKFHGINPRAVLGNGAPLQRDAQGRCIRYVALVLDESGRTQRDPDDPTQVWQRAAVEQGEAAPLPFPGLVEAALR